MIDNGILPLHDAVSTAFTRISIPVEPQNLSCSSPKPVISDAVTQARHYRVTELCRSLSLSFELPCTLPSQLSATAPGSLSYDCYIRTNDMCVPYRELCLLDP